MFKPSLLALLLAITIFTSQKAIVAEARALPFIPKQRYSSVFATLGVVCKCCNGEGGECTSTWNLSCSNLQCLPWKI
ncbi:hypothetical protein CFOL_v3_08969 [Cephalotus follicularis]|uniref:Uncharacterized protein n=1 Tax=Cephalotus follicularis TaxID=3775 RepID=A0A1Q3BCA3_CEPFO|nr:hypothetical protein CFOL_v3_08969 [Cephalotus follicularis]